MSYFKVETDHVHAQKRCPCMRQHAAPVRFTLIEDRLVILGYQNQSLSRSSSLHVSFLIVFSTSDEE